MAHGRHSDAQLSGESFLPRQPDDHLGLPPRGTAPSWPLGWARGQAHQIASPLLPQASGSSTLKRMEAAPASVPAGKMPRSSCPRSLRCRTICPVGPPKTTSGPPDTCWRRAGSGRHRTRSDRTRRCALAVGRCRGQGRSGRPGTRAACRGTAPQEPRHARPALLPASHPRHSLCTPAPVPHGSSGRCREHLESAAGARSASHLGVVGQHRRVEELGHGDVAGVVSSVVTA